MTFERYSMVFHYFANKKKYADEICLQIYHMYGLLSFAKKKLFKTSSHVWNSHKGVQPWKLSMINISWFDLSYLSQVCVSCRCLSYFFFNCSCHDIAEILLKLVKLV